MKFFAIITQVVLIATWMRVETLHHKPLRCSSSTNGMGVPLIVENKLRALISYQIPPPSRAVDAYMVWIYDRGVITREKLGQKMKKDYSLKTVNEWDSVFESPRLRNTLTETRLCCSFLDSIDFCYGSNLTNFQFEWFIEVEFLNFISTSQLPLDNFQKINALIYYSKKNGNL